MATSSESLAPVVTDAQLELVRKTVANGATADELKLYLYDCQRQGVHPLDRLLHFTKRGGKYTPVTSIDLMRIRAAETGEYAGSDDAAFTSPHGAPFPEQATVAVWRLVQGTRCPFTATARWSEYFPGEQSGHMWKKMPHTMLAKCAEGLALRKGFPRQLAGLYAKEELDQAGESQNGSGHSVTAPSASRVEEIGTLQQTSAAAPLRTPEHAEVAGSTPAPATNLPPGAVYLTKVDSGTGKAKAFLYTSDMPRPYENGLPVYNDTLATIAEQRCQDGRPVHLTLKTSAAGKDYITAITDAQTGELDDERDSYQEPVDEKDLPF